MTNDALALLRAIILNPDEDTPRLAFADEIQFTEPRRAEYIRDLIWLYTIGSTARVLTLPSDYLPQYSTLGIQIDAFSTRYRVRATATGSVTSI